MDDITILLEQIQEYHALNILSVETFDIVRDKLEDILTIIQD